GGWAVGRGGRIGFRGALSQPLYVPRPTVEPERFASLRPPTYGGAMTNPAGERGAGGQAGGPGLPGGANATNLGFGGGIGNWQGNPGAQGGMVMMNGAAFNRYQFNGQLGNLGGQWGFQGGNSAIALNGQCNDFSP